MNLLAGKRDPLDFVLLALRSGYFFPGKLIVNHKTLKRYQLAVRKRKKAFLKIWSLSTPASAPEHTQSTTTTARLHEFKHLRKKTASMDLKKRLRPRPHVSGYF